MTHAEAAARITMFRSLRHHRRKRAMHRLASVSTSLLFAAHVVLGCCAHHAHAHEGEAWHEEGATSVCCDGRCDHAGVGQTPSHDAGDCPSHCCSHVWCTFVRVEQAQIDRDVAPAISAVLPISPAISGHASGAPTEDSTIATPSAQVAHLYLVNCALLN